MHMSKTKIFNDLRSAYADSEVTSGEFYHQEEISLEYNEDDVREGIQMFLDWDESSANFVLEKGEDHWIIIDVE